MAVQLPHDTLPESPTEWRQDPVRALAILNPATLLPDTSTQESVLHTCQEILAEELGTRRHLQDQPLPDAQLTWFTDGSSYVIEGKRVARAVVEDDEQTI